MTRQTYGAKDKIMNVDRIVMAFAGTMILISVTLSIFLNMWWLGLAIFVGLNLLQASLTGFCPLAVVLRKVGIRPGAAF